MGAGGDDDEGGACPICGLVPEAPPEGACAHFVTSYDATFPYASGVYRCAVDACDDVVGPALEELNKALKGFLGRERAPTAGSGTPFPARLRELIADARLATKAEDGELTLDQDRALRTFGHYLQGVVEGCAADGKMTEHDINPGPGLSSTYRTFWAQDGAACRTDVARTIRQDMALLESEP
jgi:hypothetical protein